MNKIDKEFKALSVILDSKAILGKIISKYNIDEPHNCFFYQKGCVDKYIIEAAEKSKYYLFVYREKLRTKKSLDVELKALEKLENIPTFHPLRTNNDELINEINTLAGRLYLVLFEKNNLLLARDKDCIKDGEDTAKMHLVLNSLNHFKGDLPVFDFNYLYEKPLETMKPFLSDTNFKYLSETYFLLKIKVLELLKNEDRNYAVCNGNLQTFEAFDKINDELFSDFNWLNTGWRSFDLSTYLWSINLTNDYNEWSGEAKKNRQIIWFDFLQGYKKYINLSENEIEAVKYFLPFNILRRINFNLTNKYGKVGWQNYDKEYINHKVDFIRNIIISYQLDKE